MSALLSVALAAIGIWPQFGTDPLEASFPLEASGDIHFQVDAVVFQDGGLPSVELELALPQDAFESPADSLDLAIRVEMLGGDGNSRAAYVTTLDLPPDTTLVTEGAFPVPNRWIRLYPKWVPGTVGLRVRVDDETALKRGLFDKLRGVHRHGEAAGRLVVPGGVIDSLRVSGILFAWGQAPEERRQDGPGLRAVRSRLQPNPYRFYGLYQPVLSTYWERYPDPTPAGLAPGAPLRAEYRIVHLPDESLALKIADEMQLDATPRWELKRFDISDLPSGAYRLEIALRDTSGTVTLGRSSGRFQVLWEKQRWLVDEFDLESIARVLLTSAAYDSFAGLERGGQEAYLREFWNRHDPTPPGQPNALEQEFYARVAAANANFTRYRPGMTSDRGRVFIRYGPPDEITANLNPQDEELLRFILPQVIDDDDPSMSLEQR
ncbi:MAG: GWxTD domain-containing protein, partial [Candidatus Eisenbacteria bacterium]|nr:GWxTD domain-containing protein [Candidatus Eisenbacteria bacterium]